MVSLVILVTLLIAGDPVFVPHALLLRATMYALWRQDELALVDYEAVINFPGLEPQVCIGGGGGLLWNLKAITC